MVYSEGTPIEDPAVLIKNIFMNISKALGYYMLLFCYAVIFAACHAHLAPHDSKGSPQNSKELPQKSKSVSPNGKEISPNSKKTPQSDEGSAQNVTLNK
jgi:hypothetical protein